MRLSILLEAVPGVLYRPDFDIEITAPVTDDSREIRSGGLFVARHGLVTDGHKFIRAAVDAGAVAIIGELPPEEVNVPVPYVQVADGRSALAYLAAAYHGFPSREMVVVGVTGTDGKTTTSTLIFHILRAAGFRAGMINTVSAILGGEEVPTGLHVTTPPAPDVQRYLARMRANGITHVVLEATSHGLAQGRVLAVDFDMAVMTNVTHEHLDFHGSWEAYRDAKADLFRMLGSSGSTTGLRRWGIVNADDPSAGYFSSLPGPDEVLMYGLRSGAADLWAEDISYGPDETRIELSGRWGRLRLRTRLVGEFNVYNVMGAVGTALALGIERGAIEAGVAEMRPIPGRMERIDEGQDFLAIVDFAHTPNGLRNALKAARMMSGDGGRVIAVFGSAGLRDPAKRGMMGRIGAELADLTVLTAEDPRTESLEAILEEMAAGCRSVGGVEGETFWIVPDRGRAIHFACKLARPGDVVIACGKGHEQSMCFGETEYPWDDREAMRSALRGEPLLTLPTA